MSGKSKNANQCDSKRQGRTMLRSGDMVMVISGGSGTKRVVKGRVGKVIRFIGEDRQKAIVEGLNMVTKHKRPTRAGEKAEKIQKEAPIHVSRLMYYVEKIKRPVRLKHVLLADGTKVRAYKDPVSKELVQIVN